MGDTGENESRHGNTQLLVVRGSPHSASRVGFALSNYEYTRTSNFLGGGAEGGEVHRSTSP